MKRKNIIFISAILMLLSILSCSSNDTNEYMAPMPTATTAPMPTATTAPTDNTTMSSMTDAVSEVSILMSEWDVSVDSTSSIKEGKIKLTLVNNGNLEHNMVLLNSDNYENLELTDDSSMADESKLDILGKISGLQPGESGELLLEDIGPGTYAFICNTPGHYQLGMVNKIIVE